MNTIVYTLINYVPGVEGWHDRCGDYHSGSESDLKIEYFTDKESIGVAYGQAKFDNEDSEFTILINGINADKYHDFLTEEEQNDLTWEEDEIRNIGTKKYEELKEIARKKEEDAKLKKQQEEELKKQKEKERIEQAERAQLAQLMAKYN